MDHSLHALWGGWHPRPSDQHTDVQRAQLGDWLTNAEEGCEHNALPPPVRHPEETACEGGLPRRCQGDEAVEVARDQRLDGCGEDEEKRAEEDVADHVAGGPEWILLQKMLGNGVMDLLQCDRGRNEGTGEPKPRVSICHARTHEDRGVVTMGRGPPGVCRRDGRLREASPRHTSGDVRGVVALTVPRTRDRS